MYRFDVGGRLFFRPMTDSLEDAYLVCRWRNTDVARQAFYNRQIVTPDTHVMFMRNRKPHDLIWVIHAKDIGPIGMTSLTIDVDEGIAEYGRAFIDPVYSGHGYGQEQEYMVLALAFELFNLRYLWGDVLAGNNAALNLHYKTGWVGVGIDVPGHTHARGPVMHIEYLRETWPEYRQRFVVELGVSL